MSELHETSNSPRNYAEHVLELSKDVLSTAVGIVNPDNPTADPLSVFPNPKEVRDEDKGIPLSEEQTSLLLDRALDLGFGRPENVTLSEQGITDAIVIIEGGQPHKMLSELLVVTEDSEAKPVEIIITASAKRKVINEGEVASAQRLFGGSQLGLSEYDMALQMLPKIKSFRGPTNTEVESMGELLVSYDIDNNYAVSEESTGQLTRVGYIDQGGIAIPVTLLRVDREDYVEDGKEKYRKQPNTEALLSIVDDVTRQTPTGTNPIVLVTSGAYRPSRTAGAALAGLKSDRSYGLVTYGNDLLNEVRGTNSPPPVNQLPGELHLLAKQVQELEQALSLA